MPRARGGPRANKVGEWAFLLGVLLAVVFALLPYGTLDTATLTSILVILGVIVGLLNVSRRDTTGYLVASVALLISSAVGFSAVPIVGGFIASALANLTYLIAPAAVIVSLKAIFSLAKG